MEVQLCLNHDKPVVGLLRLATTTKGVEDVMVMLNDEPVALPAYLRHVNKGKILRLPGLSAAKVRILADARSGPVMFYSDTRYYPNKMRLYINFLQEPVRAISRDKDMRAIPDFLSAFFPELRSPWYRIRKLHREFAPISVDKAQEWLDWPEIFVDESLPVQQRLL